MPLSPLEVDILMHCCTRRCPFPNSDNAVVASQIRDFLNLGAICPVAGQQDVYCTTPLGDAWVKAICAVPPPRQVFVDELGRIIE